MAVKFGDKILYEGAVLGKFERNGYDDSDFLAIVWDGEKITTYEYDTTRFAGGGSATIDATPEVIAKAERALAAAYERQFEMDHYNPCRKGVMVRSITKRGKNVGITGKVLWYGNNRHGVVVGVKVEGENKLRYLSAGSVEVIDPFDRDDIIVKAAETAKAHNWYDVVKR